MDAPTAARIEGVRAHALHRHLGFQSLTAEAGRAVLTAEVGGECTLNPAGAMHGGVMYVFGDVAAYAATLSLLGADEEAVTHNLHISVLRAGAAGMRVEFTATVKKRGRQLAFIDVEVTGGGKTLATLSVTKSIISRTPSQP